MPKITAFNYGVQDLKPDSQVPEHFTTGLSCFPVALDPHKLNPSLRLHYKEGFQGSKAATVDENLPLSFTLHTNTTRLETSFSGSIFYLIIWFKDFSFLIRNSFRRAL